LGKLINASTEDNNKSWKLIENYGRVEKCQKEKLANMFRLVRISIGDLERFRI